MFTLTMRTTNDEFEQAGLPRTIARLLREAADKVENGYESGSIHDINGGGIGKFEIDLRAEDKEVERDLMYDTLAPQYDSLVAEAHALFNAAGEPIDKAKLEDFDILSVDVEHCYDVDLQLQGPTEFVRIHCTPDDEAHKMLWTNSYGEVTVTRNIQQNTPLWYLMAHLADVQP